MTCAGVDQPIVHGHCGKCDRFAPATIADGAPMPAHTRAALTDSELLALIPRHPWERAQERIHQQAVRDLLEPKGDDDGKEA